MGNLENGVISMIPDDNLFRSAEQFPNSESELQRVQTLEKLGLLEPGSIPIFEEATQTAAHFLNMPICVLGILDRNRIWFKSAVGLSRIGLMNNLASTRQLSRQDAFCARVVESQRALMVADAIADPALAQSSLVQRYGIRSYLGVPLLMADGQCIGALAVMGLVPRTFSDQEVSFLELAARWSMSEFERDYLQQLQQIAPTSSAVSLQPSTSIKASLLSQMAQELCTPLTSILGMAKVLNQGIYGALSDKQQEYMQIIHSSGQHLLSLINELVELGSLDEQNPDLNLNPVDIEMLCQQVISALNQVAQRREQHLQLTVEPGNRIWLLDKDKVRQILYHLVFSVIQSSSSDSTIRIHVSRRQTTLHLSIWSSHPWLGEGLPQIELAARQTILRCPSSNLEAEEYSNAANWEEDWLLTADAAAPPVAPAANSRQSLGLMLSQQLAELLSGDIVIQGTAEEGYRYVVRLPQIKPGEEPAS